MCGLRCVRWTGNGISSRTNAYTLRFDVSVFQNYIENWLYTCPHEHPHTREHTQTLRHTRFHTYTCTSAYTHTYTYYMLITKWQQYSSIRGIAINGYTMLRLAWSMPIFVDGTRAEFICGVSMSGALFTLPWFIRSTVKSRIFLTRTEFLLTIISPCVTGPTCESTSISRL